MDFAIKKLLTHSPVIAIRWHRR